MKTLYALLLLTVFAKSAGAITVSITQTGTGANSCSRSLTANVGSGSGNYTYTWSIVTPSMSWPGPNNISTVTLAPTQIIHVNVSVHDNTLNQTSNATETVYGILSGSFNTFIPNLITPNGDGYNDNWIVTDAAKTYSPINAYGYTLTIKNSSNTIVFSASGTVSASHLGIIGGDIIWNARVNGTGSIVPVGTYTYSLTLQNCSQSTNFSASLSVMY